MELSYKLAIICAGIFFLNALLTGVWKYLQMASNANGLAHPYVDTAHRASLLYSFASILLAEFVKISTLPQKLEVFALSLLLFYFAIAIIGYMMHGYAQKTDNQIKDITPVTRVLMWSLIFAEIGGFLIIFYGVLRALFS